MPDLDEAQNERVRKRMREWMGETGETQADLARHIRRAAPSINAILNGKGGFSHETVRRFAAFLRIDERELLGPRVAAPETKAPAAAGKPTALDLAAPLAVFDGARVEDVTAARAHPDAADGLLSGGDAYGLIMRAKRKREQTAAMGAPKGLADALGALARSVPPPPAPPPPGRSAKRT